VKNLRVLTCKE